MLKEMYYFKEDKVGFSNNLKRLIKENGYTANDVADMLGNNYYELLKKWKTGERLPSFDDIHKLAKIFKISMDELYLPNSILKISKNDYTNIYTSTSPTKFEILKRYYPAYVKDEEIFDNLSIDEFKSQKDLKEEINYLLQKKLFSFLTEDEDDKLRFYFDNMICKRYYDSENEIHFERLDYDGFWKNVDEDMKYRKGVSYKYKITYDEMQREYYEFKKKIEFSPCKFMQFIVPQYLGIDETIDGIKDDNLLKEYFDQFDVVTLNCIYTSKNVKKQAKKILSELGCRTIKAKFDPIIESSDDLIEEVKKLTYDEYLKSIGGKE